MKSPTKGPQQSEIDTVLAALSSTPNQIARMTRGRTEAELSRAPQAGAWSVREIVDHLRACAEVWGRSIDRMLAEDHPTIRYMSPRGWMKKTDFLEQDFRESFESFTVARARLVETLSALPARDWLRGATFTATTLGREATVLSYARRIADHEAQHLEQIRRTLPN